MKPSRHLDLDFIAAPRATRVGRGVLLLGVLGAAVGAGFAADAWHARAAEQEVLSGLVVANAPRVSRVPPDPAMVRVAAMVTSELQMPWGQLLLALEAIPSRDVAVLTIEPTAAQRTLRITADARHADAMLDYVAQLKQQALTQVVLTSHQFQPQTPGAPIRFQVQARWGDVARSGLAAPVLAAGVSTVAAGSAANVKDQP